MKRKVLAIILTITMILSNTTAMAAVPDGNVDVGGSNIGGSNTENVDPNGQTQGTSPETGTGQGSEQPPETGTTPDPGVTPDGSTAPETGTSPDSGAGQGGNPEGNQGQVPQEQAPAKVSTTYIDENNNQQTVDATPITVGMTSLTTGWYVVDSKVTILQRINITGEVNIILKDGFIEERPMLSAKKGISVTEGNTLKIYGQEEGKGSIWVTMPESTGNAGIGGIIHENPKLRNAGTVEIHGGEVASHNSSGPGIGGANGTETFDAGNNGVVKISGGAVSAASGNAAGIGGGYSPNGKNGTAGNIEISGGYVSAGSGNNGSAIGIGGPISEGNLGNVKISGNAVVIADAKPQDGVPVIEESNRNNWNGIVFEKHQNQDTTKPAQCAAKVYGNVNLKRTIYILDKYNLEIPENSTLTVEPNGKIEEAIRGTLSIENKGTLIVEGKITNIDTINNTGTITNQGNGVITSNRAIINNTGTITNQGNGTITSNGVFDNTSTINNKDNGKINNNGNINNGGTITNQGNGTITNAGNIYNDKTIINLGTGKIENTGNGAISNNMGEIISDSEIQGITGNQVQQRKEATVELTFEKNNQLADKVIEGETIDIIAKIAGELPLQKTSDPLNKVKFYQGTEAAENLLGEADVVNDTATFKLEVTGEKWKAQNSPYSIVAVFAGSKELKPASQTKQLTVVQGTYYIDENDQKKFVEATPITAGTIALETGWYVVKEPKLEISERIKINGTVNLIVADGSLLSANKGISVTEGNTLKFYGQEKGNGQIWVTMRESTGNAGIGGIVSEDPKLRNSGTVEIHGGIITSLNSSGPGIGGANGTETLDAGNNGNVKITGGSVSAGSGNAAGIGGGYSPNGKNGKAGNIEISGGYVSARSGDNGSAIGIGGSISEGNLGTVKISGDAFIEAEAKPLDGVPVIEESNKNNWKGIVFENRMNEDGSKPSQYLGKVYGNVNLKQDIYIKANYKLEIPKGTNLTVETNGGIEVFSDAAIENKGTLLVNGQITNDGAINNTGSIINKGSGTITNNGTIDNTTGEIQSDVTVQGSGSVSGNSVKPLAPPTPPTPPSPPIVWPPIVDPEPQPEPQPQPEPLPENVPDGSVVENGNIVTPNGTTIKPNGEIVLPGGTVLPVENGKKPEIDKTGTVTLPDGTFITVDQKVHKTDESIWELDGSVVRPATPVFQKVITPGKSNKVVAYLDKECAGADKYNFVISKDPNCIETGKYERVLVGQKNGKAVFYRIPKGKYYVFCRNFTLNDKGEKVYSNWSKCGEIVVTAKTPKQPKAYKVKVYKDTVKVTFKKVADAKHYEVVLGKGLKKVNGEMRPVKYGKAIKKIKSQKNSITVTFKKIPKGKYYIGIRGYNFTAKGGNKVLGVWSKAKVIRVR